MEEAAFYRPDWSLLPQDLMAMVMRRLDNIPDLFHAGTACTAWYAAYSAVRRARVPITDCSPCLLYSSGASDSDDAAPDDTATIYSPSAGVAFKVRLPAPAFRVRRCVVGSGHGWVVTATVTADEASNNNLQALNPLTGAQVDLPPVVTGFQSSSSSAAAAAYITTPRLVYEACDGEQPQARTGGAPPLVYTTRELPVHLHHRVYLSCRPSAGRHCTAMLLDTHNGHISVARVGDDRWTPITRSRSKTTTTFPRNNNGYTSAVYNENDRTWYVLSSDSSIHTFNLNGPSPKVRKITDPRPASSLDDLTARYYIVLAPWGDILHVQRHLIVRTFATRVVPADAEHELTGPCCVGSLTHEIQLYKVDVHDRKLVQISSSDLQGHALFLGFNSALMRSTKDFLRLKPNCVYLTEDNWEHAVASTRRYVCQDVGIWDFTGALESIADVQPWLNWPPTIWITPSLS